SAAGRVSVVDRDRSPGTRCHHGTRCPRGAPPLAAKPRPDRHRRPRPARGRDGARTAMSPDPVTLNRNDVYPTALIDGRPAANGTSGRFNRRFQRLLTSRGEAEEAELEQRIRSLPGVTRPNTVALISPKGGVGKTTSTFVVGNLLATHLKLRVIAVDANPDFGTLARLSPDRRRSERSLADLLDDADR